MTATVTAVIDRPSRDIAASLIRRFRDGALTNDQFCDDWPCGSDDRALLAIDSMLWHFYSDVRAHTLTLTPEGYALFSRCALFADGDLADEWEWPGNEFIGTKGFGLGSLVFFLARALQLFDRRAVQRMKASGNFDIWPFIRHSDYDAARVGKSGEQL